MSPAKICTRERESCPRICSRSRIATEYASSPVEQPGVHPEGPVQRCDVHEARDHIAGQYGECLWVPEEVRHADEQIAEQLVRFARAIAQPLDVCRNRWRL